MENMRKSEHMRQRECEMKRHYYHTHEKYRKNKNKNDNERNKQRYKDDPVYRKKSLEYLREYRMSKKINGSGNILSFLEVK